MDNRLLTIMFLDVQGYTRRTAQATREETSRFVEEMRAFVQLNLEKFQGKLVKTMGDGFLASFESPTNAVQCGLEMQRQIRLKNATIPNPDQYTRFRVGVNTGEVSIDDGGDLFGDPVNIAARIESFAESGEVFISEATFLAMNRNEVGTLDLGPQMFKNATREIRVYKILDEKDPRKGAAGAGGVSPSGTPRTGPGKGRPWLWALGGVAGTLALVLVIFLVRRSSFSGRSENRTGTPPGQVPAMQPHQPAAPASPPGEEPEDEKVEGVPPFGKMPRPPAIQQNLDLIDSALEKRDPAQASKLVKETLGLARTIRFQFPPRDLAKMSWILSVSGFGKESEELLEVAIERASENPRLSRQLRRRMGMLKSGKGMPPLGEKKGPGPD